MANTELQREYTLATALCDIAIGGAENDTAKVKRASEWVGILVAELETKLEHLEHLLTARMRNESQPPPDSFRRRCGVSVPKQCVLQHGHGGHSHVSNSGTMWPVDGNAREMCG
jgi:uncharacterized protein YegL